MYCSKCGAEIAAGNIFCSSCGEKNNNEGNTPSNEKTEHKTDDPKILEKLKKFEKLDKCKCLECGYEGLMGVEGRYYTTGFIISLIIDVILLIIFAFGSWFWSILIIGLMIWEINTCKMKLYCPNCDKTVVTK